MIQIRKISVDWFMNMEVLFVYMIESLLVEYSIAYLYYLIHVSGLFYRSKLLDIEIITDPKCLPKYPRKIEVFRVKNRRG